MPRPFKRGDSAERSDVVRIVRLRRRRNELAGGGCGLGLRCPIRRGNGIATTATHAGQHGQQHEQQNQMEISHIKHTLSKRQLRGATARDVPLELPRETSKQPGKTRQSPVPDSASIHGPGVDMPSVPASLLRPRNRTQNNKAAQRKPGTAFAPHTQGRATYPHDVAACCGRRIRGEPDATVPWVSPILPPRH